MPKKPEKWRIKFWVLINSSSKFIYYFDIYCGKNLEAEVRIEAPYGQGSAVYCIVMNFLQGLEENNHCVVMDNFFASIPLFRDLASKGIYATCTVRTNQIGILLHLKNTRTWKRCEQGHLEWAMHGSRGLSCIMWKEKYPVCSFRRMHCL